MIRAAIIFVNYGPYHVARAAALAATAEVDPIFVELASGEKKYPWIADKSSISEKLVTLTNQDYESCRIGDLSRKLIDKLDELDPDAVVIAGYGELPMRSAAKWARATGKHVVMMSDSTRQDYKRYWWREQIKRGWVARNVDAGFVAGRAAREYLVQLGVPDEKIWEQYDVVDNQYFTECAKRVRGSALVAREKAKLPEHYFLYVGRFSQEKNLLMLLTAYKRYRDSSDNPWGLVLVGDGPQREELIRIAQAEGLSEIVWPGFKHVNELPLYYALADCLVLPSVRDPWGLVVNEAMASSLPVLVSDSCGCSLDLVQHEVNGYVFDSNNVGQLAELMTKLSSFSSTRLGKMGQASLEIISQFTPEHWARNLFQALTAVRGQAEIAEAELMASSAS